MLIRTGETNRFNMKRISYEITNKSRFKALVL